MTSNTTPEPKDLPLFKHLLNLIGIWKTPDSAEDIEQEIQEILEDGEEQGLITAQEGMMISSIFDFKDTTAKEIMTPKTEMVCAPESATIPEITAIITEKGFTRIPIFADSPDHITGFLHAKDLLRYCSINQDPPLAGEIVNQPLFIQENEKIGKLLRDFKTKKTHIAIISDEFGTVRGLVTLEDVLEEIVGEITDEYDKDEMRWKVTDDNTVLTDAKIDLEEVESFFKTSLPEGPYESIGGLVIHQLGHLPKVGEAIQVQGLQIKVLSASKRRISSLKIHRTQPKVD